MRLIDADALKNTIKNMPNDYYGDLCIGDALKEIDNAPTIDAVPVVRGEWRQGKEFSTYPRVPFISTAYYCSNCEEEAYWDTDYGQQLFDFCPNCGAKMDLNRAEAEDALKSCCNNITKNCDKCKHVKEEGKP